ncbi:MAG: hydrogenase 4 subunit F, partial [Alistipes sp.]|nr:hydrogenase 4 subunit F [Alistipes sp.]
MLFALYMLLSAAVAASTLAARGRRTMHLAGTLYYLLQALFAGWLLAGGGYATQVGALFAFDAAGTLFYLLLVAVSFWVFHHSETYLSECDQRQTRTYFALVMLLTTAIAGAYFASNMAVTWIFLEATTLCSAGIIYHRRTTQTLEAAWKYVFVCSTGIAMAYLGILLLAAATKCESLAYETVAAVAAQGNPLYLKIAFLLILCGYSCKMELFPLYTVGVDANFAAPAPAAALISTGLVNAGFVALLRVYRLLAGTEVFGWAKSVLLLVGVLSLGIGALFLRRTNNYKRFLSYSTVENMGIAAIGLGIG